MIPPILLPLVFVVTPLVLWLAMAIIRTFIIIYDAGDDIRNRGVDRSYVIRSTKDELKVIWTYPYTLVRHTGRKLFGNLAGGIVALFKGK